eukprot:1741868-Lingulodinium_polyedra.AAC.1
MGRLHNFNVSCRASWAHGHNAVRLVGARDVQCHACNCPLFLLVLVFCTMVALSVRSIAIWHRNAT